MWCSKHQLIIKRPTNKQLRYAEELRRAVREFLRSERSTRVPADWVRKQVQDATARAYGSECSTAAEAAQMYASLLQSLESAAAVE